MRYATILSAVDISFPKDREVLDAISQVLSLCRPSISPLRPRVLLREIRPQSCAPCNFPLSRYVILSDFFLRRRSDISKRTLYAFESSNRFQFYVHERQVRVAFNYLLIRYDCLSRNPPHLIHSPKQLIGKAGFPPSPQLSFPNLFLYIRPLIRLLASPATLQSFWSGLRPLLLSEK